jgi:hypothetical protein
MVYLATTDREYVCLDDRHRLLAAEMSKLQICGTDAEGEYTLLPRPKAAEKAHADVAPCKIAISTNAGTSPKELS